MAAVVISDYAMLQRRHLLVIKLRDRGPTVAMLKNINYLEMHQEEGSNHTHMMQ